VYSCLPISALKEVEPDLTRLGNDVLTSVSILHGGLGMSSPYFIAIQDLDKRMAPPKLTQYDHWGRRIDELQTSEGWRTMRAIAQKEGLPGIFYERKYGEHSRAYGFAKMLIMTGDAHVVSFVPVLTCANTISSQCMKIFCPLSMTDGTARVIELQGSEEMKKQILPRLVR
jgi:hypothetical protein